MADSQLPMAELRRLLHSDGFDALFSEHAEGIYVYAADGRFVEGNPAMLGKFGYSPAQLARTRFGLLIHPDDRELAEAEFAATVRGEVRQFIATGVGRTGETVRSRITQVPFMRNGATIAVIGISADLAVLERAIASDQQSARQAEARLSSVLNSISDGLLFVDRDYRATYLNPRAEQILQVSAADVRDRVLWDVFPEALGSEFSIGYAVALAEQRTVTILDTYAPLDRWLEITAYPTEDGLALYLRDVDDRERARLELAERDAELAAQSALLDNARDSIIVRGLDSSIRFWNAASRRIYGWTSEEVMGRLARDVLYADPSQFDRVLQLTLRDGHWLGELRQIDKAGSDILVESSWTLVRDERGEPESIFSVNTDVTEKRRAEERALRTQRMESLGTLASGMAHDLNNVLTPILMAVQLLAPDEKDPRRREILESTELAVKRGADMIRQVLSFASGATVQRVQVDLGRVLAELTSICAESLPPSISVVFEVDDDLRPTEGDATQLLQVLLNLVSNARDAMPDGGTIHVRAHDITLTDGYSSVSHIAAPGEYVMIEVEDDGEGIPRAVLDKIFEPFFTTKASGKGTGLGLSTSLAVIRGHGGYMQAYSEPGRGSVLRLHLPAGSPAAGRPEARVPVEDIPRGNGELVLVVDDEAAIRTLTRQTLDTYGYVTAVASNGAEAIEYLEAAATRVDLVLTDMAMPVMDGAATAAYLLKHYPDIPVIAASGLNANGGVARAESLGVRRFLAKPYTTADLLGAIHDALASQEGSS